MKTFARGLVLLLALLFVPVPASADDAIGKQRFKEGSAAYQQGRYQEAARLFTSAAKLGHPMAAYNLGLCLNQLVGRPLGALATLLL